MRIGYCAGLAASKEDGLQFPRSIIQVPDHDQFIIADMGAWVPFKGRLLLFDPALAPGHRTKVLLESQGRQPTPLLICLRRSCTLGRNAIA